MHSTERFTLVFVGYVAGGSVAFGVAAFGSSNVLYATLIWSILGIVLASVEAGR